MVFSGDKKGLIYIELIHNFEYRLNVDFLPCVLPQNMVGPGEVDDDLEPETAEECTKYGEVNKVVIYEVFE